jgi:hypothetical protein
MRPLLLLAPLAFLALAGCTSAAEPQTAVVRSPSTPAASEIVRLRTHDGDVAVLAGGAGRRVTVYAADGSVVVSDADLDDLRASRPDVVEILTNSVATRPSFLDARVYEDDVRASGGAPLGDHLK